MPKSRKKKIPVTKMDLPSTSSSTSASQTRNTIRRFHVLLKQKSNLIHTSQGATATLASIETEMEELGGLEKYQAMSAIGQSSVRGGGSEKVLLEWLKQLGMERDEKLQLLEVGALKSNNYAPHKSWIDNTPIDLHSRHPDIQEQDFLLMDPASNAEKWDIISLSLVLNFVPNAQDRGKMLSLAHKFLKPDGILFLVLPLPCVQNSRYLTHEHLQELMHIIGFQLVFERWKTTGKVAYWLFRRDDQHSDPKACIDKRKKFTKKVVLREGNRNNFCVLLS